MIRHFFRDIASERPPPPDATAQTPRHGPVERRREETREETRREEQDESGAEGPDRGERDETRVTSGHTTQRSAVARPGGEAGSDAPDTRQCAHQSSSITKILQGSRVDPGVERVVRSLQVACHLQNMSLIHGWPV